MNNTELSLLIKQRCQALVEQAQLQYHLPQAAINKLSINCDLRGRSAGKIELRYAPSLGGKSLWRKTRQLSSIKLRFNLQAAKLDLQDMLQNTLAHEVAHLVIALSPERYQQQAHGKDWQRVCLALGGNAQTRHSLALSHARIQRRWPYRDSLGQQHELSTVRHNRLQQGAIYHVKQTGAQINASGFQQYVHNCNEDG